MTAMRLHRVGRIFLVWFVLTSSVGRLTVVSARAESRCMPDDLQTSGAVYRICMPALGAWNGDLVVYAHGYVAFDEPIAIPEDQLAVGGISLAKIANQLGFAFAVTSYRINGLAVREGLDDLSELVEIFSAAHGKPARVYLVGPSEGGLITALALERHAEVFDGGLSACGPVGNFRWQINYWGDVRVLFDYFFPQVLPGSPVAIPAEVIDDWDTVYALRVAAALRGAPDRLSQLMATAHIPAHPTNDEANIASVASLLWYNVFATNDGIAKLGGQPYENRHRYYFGSDNDGRLNQEVARFDADPAAIEEMENHYQTSGDIGHPLVTLHTLGDPIVPYWHEPLYRLRIEAQSRASLHTNIPIVLRYGHCNFSVPQLLLAFVVLVWEVSDQLIVDAERALPTAEERAEYRALAAAYGLLPTSRPTLYLPIVLSSSP
jgi:hypothetical protein